MEGHLKENPDDQSVRLYYGLSLLNLSEVNKAVSQFGSVIGNATDPDFQAAARWYQALSYIKLNERKEAINALKLMIDQNHYQSLYATELLEKVKAN